MTRILLETYYVHDTYIVVRPVPIIIFVASIAAVAIAIALLRKRR